MLALVPAIKPAWRACLHMPSSAAAAGQPGLSRLPAREPGRPDPDSPEFLERRTRSTGPEPASRSCATSPLDPRLMLFARREISPGAEIQASVDLDSPTPPTVRRLITHRDLPDRYRPPMRWSIPAFRVHGIDGLPRCRCFGHARSGGRQHQRGRQSVIAEKAADLIQGQPAPRPTPSHRRSSAIARVHRAP